MRSSSYSFRHVWRVRAFRIQTQSSGLSRQPLMQRHVAGQAGPLPRGDYDILDRIQNGNLLLDGVPAWALDRRDRTPLDDVAQGYGRGAFRFHFGDSQGCVTTYARKGFAAAVAILNH